MSQGLVQEGSHGGAEGQGQAQTGMAGSGQWYIDSGATHHVTPEATKVVQGTEYAGPDAKCGVVPSTLETSGRSSNELLVIPELDKLRRITTSEKNATDEHMCQKGGEEITGVHEGGSNSRRDIDEECQEETRIGGGVLDNDGVGSHEDMHNEALAGGSGESGMEDELCSGCVEGLENGLGSDQSADRDFHSQCEEMQTGVENGVGESQVETGLIEECATAGIELNQQANQHPMITRSARSGLS
ncbi:hypothetical protein V6N12_063223 [Hibiscus sabdariffa]|uniref:Uncharacterized protein n=1 Tax=Hibiscus sabdariffa TaxID=183260 RepID=A0ABR2FB29_9ROSI